MKKHLITAVMAIVAVGGVLTTKAITYYGPGGTPEYQCDFNGALCSSIQGEVYSSATDQNEDTLVPPASRLGKLQQ